MKRFLFCFLFVLSSLALKAHPFHVSVCELEYNSKSQRYEMAIKVFTDDFTLALQAHQAEVKDINILEKHSKIDEAIINYIDTYFLLAQGEQNLALHYIGKEGDEDAVWLYFETESIAFNDVILAKNMILFDQFDDQSNLLHYRCDANTNSYMFQKTKIEQSISCKE